MLCQDKKCHSR